MNGYSDAVAVGRDDGISQLCLTTLKNKLYGGSFPQHLKPQQVLQQGVVKEEEEGLGQSLQRLMKVLRLPQH